MSVVKAMAFRFFFNTFRTLRSTNKQHLLDIGSNTLGTCTSTSCRTRDTVYNVRY